MTNPHPGVWDQSFSQISSINVTGPHSLVLTLLATGGKFLLSPPGRPGVVHGIADGSELGDPE